MAESQGVEVVVQWPIPGSGSGFVKAMAVADIDPGELAKAEAVSPTTVSRWRGGERPDDLRLPQLADRLRVSLKWLKTGEGLREAVGAMVVGEESYPTPYGVTAREAMDSIDLGAVAPDQVAKLAALEFSYGEGQGEPMTVKRLLWWLDRAYEAGQRSMATPSPVPAPSTEAARAAGKAAIDAGLGMPKGDSPRHDAPPKDAG